MSTHTSPEGSSPVDAQQDRDEIIINELIDAEAAGDAAAARTAFKHAATQNPALARRLADTRRVLMSFDRLPSHPDFTDEILEAAHQQRPFLHRRVRRKVSAARMVVACSVLAGLSAIAVIQRTHPEAVGLHSVASADRPASLLAARQPEAHVPSTLLMDGVGADFGAPLEDLASAFAASDRPQAPALALGNTSSYESAAKWAAGELSGAQRTGDQVAFTIPEARPTTLARGMEPGGSLLLNTPRAATMLPVPYVWNLPTGIEGPSAGSPPPTLIFGNTAWTFLSVPRIQTPPTKPTPAPDKVEKPSERR